MHILQIQHWPQGFEYNNTAYFHRAGDTLDFVQICAGQRPSEPTAYDAVMVYGGYMSAYDDAGHPWLAEELSYLEACLKAEVPILGICLGSQLLARVLGAKVYRSPCPEFGFHQIRPTQEGRGHPALGRLVAGGEEDFLALEWHQDAWDLPAGARRLAGSAYWPNQAFSYGDRVLALQFHLEFTRAHMAQAVRAEAASIPMGLSCEDPEAFLADARRFDDLAANMELVLDGFLGRRVAYEVALAV